MTNHGGHSHTHDAPRPVKQEQRAATESIDELAPGVLRTQLPIDIPGLGHVNMYVLEDERGVAVVDPGLANKQSYTAIQKRLREIGVPLKRVHTVIVTHSHPDHFGGAEWIQSHSGAEIVTSRHFRVFWDPTEPPDVDVEDVPDLPPYRRPWEPTPWGGPGMNVPWRRRARMKVAQRFPKLLHLPRPT
ncbi:MAG: MBL fold metallo-hydrolase, partial [Ilumatobacteraceae bacterium]